MNRPLTHTLAWIGFVIGLAQLGGCGPSSEEGADFRPFVVTLPTDAPATYQIAWQQVVTRGDSTRNELGWKAKVELRAVGTGDHGRVVEWRDVLGEGRDLRHRFDWSPEGRIRGFKQRGDTPLAAAVGNVSMSEVLAPEAWLRARLRPLPAGGLPAPGTTWKIRDGLDGLPMPVPVEWTYEILTEADGNVELLGKGRVLVDELDATGGKRAAWIRAARHTLEAHVTLRASTGRVAHGSVRVELESDRHWDGREEPTRSINMLTIREP